MISWLPLTVGTFSVCVLSSAIPRASTGPPITDPVWQNDTIPPYPSLANVSTKNILGVRLFGWAGCELKESQDIAEAYDDFYTLAQQQSVYQSIAWDEEAAIDFFGPSRGAYAVPDDRRQQIQQIFAAAQQVYSTFWGVRPSLWIRVRCSGGDGSGDPDNICGDRPNNGGCNNGQPVTPGTSNLLQAYSNPNIEENDYSEITFCNGFFGLNNLAEAIRLGLAKSQGSARDNLDSYDNRARVFFHEVTHLDYFMSTPGQGPVIDDVKLKPRIGGITETQNAYGALWTKVLANYRARGKGGYYTQRNADTYAFFALAKYVTGKLGHYPYNPQTNLKPIAAPRNQLDQSFNTAEEPNNTTDIPDDLSVGLVSSLDGITTGPVDVMGDPLNNGIFDQSFLYIDQNKLSGCADWIVKP